MGSPVTEFTTIPRNACLLSSELCSDSKERPFRGSFNPEPEERGLGNSNSCTARSVAASRKGRTVSNTMSSTFACPKNSAIVYNASDAIYCQRFACQSPCSSAGYKSREPPRSSYCLTRTRQGSISATEMQGSREMRGVWGAPSSFGHNSGSLGSPGIRKNRVQED